MEWTPEAIKAEVDYRQAALRADAAQARVGRRSGPPRRSWWQWLVHRGEPRSDDSGEPRSDDSGEPRSDNSGEPRSAGPGGPRAAYRPADHGGSGAAHGERGRPVRHGGSRGVPPSANGARPAA